MCGIAGFLGRRRATEEGSHIARRMADAIAQRGPDGEGTWVDAQAGVGLAHRRLAIVDLSPAGQQPMLSEDSRWALTFNGEIYNHHDLRKELDQSGKVTQWRGHCDTEVLLEAIAAWGVRRTLTKCVGMFAFALWDRKDETLILARDRIGEKPLYYGWMADTFLFGSELTALQRHPDWQGEIDRDALCQLLRHSYVPAPRSIFKGIGKVVPGTVLTLKKGQREPSLEVYWNPYAVAEQAALATFGGSPEDAVAHTEDLIRRSVAGQKVADVPIGAFLSGGIDSSTVVALMQTQSSRPVRTFSIGFSEAGYDEAPFAKRVAQHLGTDHTELYVTPKEAMSVVPRLPSIYSEPFADVSQIPTFLVSELARRQVTVALSGDGGDELFSGYSRYLVGGKIWKLMTKFPWRARAIASSLMRRVPAHQYDKILRGPLQLLPAGMRPNLIGDKIHKAAGIAHLNGADEVYRALISAWQQPSDVVIGGSEPWQRVAKNGISDPVRRMMFGDLVGYLPDDILVKVDRASMAVGLEARVPLLDHRIVEFTWSLPLALLRRDGQSKWPLRQVLRRYVPQQMTTRTKMGFGVPIDSWLRGPLRSWAQDLLDETRLKREGFFHADKIGAAWRAHQSGHQNLQGQLWSVLMFQAWHEAQRASSSRSHIASVSA